MARESQRYQVGLIICIMLIVVLLGGFFFFWRSNNELKQQVVAEQAKVVAAQQAETKNSSQIQYLKAMMGVGETSMKALEQSGLTADDAIAAVKTQYDQDMKQFGQGLPEDQQTYIQIVKNLVTTLNKINEQLAEANAQIKVASDDRDRRVAELTEQVAAADAGRQTAVQNLEVATADFNKFRAEYTAKAQQDAQAIDDLSKQLADVTAAAKKREEELVKAQNNLVAQIQNLNRKLEEVEQGFASFESADGKIINVSQTQRSVWLNLGQSDGLRAQATFSVYDGQASSSNIGKPKARIEVTRVTGPHQAEARILADSLTNPIMRGDLVYSPAFRAGRQVHFALAGVVDLNDDGVSDRDLVRNLISMNGGRIDAEQLEDGSVGGEVSASTRYLILGSEPTEADIRQNPKMMEGYSAIRQSAVNFGVKTLKVEEFLDMMGWKPEVESVNLGAGASKESDESEAFRPRRPPAPMPRGEDGGAFE